MVSKLRIRSINKQTYKRDKNHLRAVSEISHNLCELPSLGTTLPAGYGVQQTALQKKAGYCCLQS